MFKSEHDCLVKNASSGAMPMDHELTAAQASLDDACTSN